MFPGANIGPAGASKVIEDASIALADRSSGSIAVCCILSTVSAVGKASRASLPLDELSSEECVDKVEIVELLGVGSEDS